MVAKERVRINRRLKRRKYGKVLVSLKNIESPVFLQASSQIKALFS
jgi:hypothetical protein